WTGLDQELRNQEAEVSRQGIAFSSERDRAVAAMQTEFWFLEYPDCLRTNPRQQIRRAPIGALTQVCKQASHSPLKDAEEPDQITIGLRLAPVSRRLRG